MNKSIQKIVMGTASCSQRKEHVSNLHSQWDETDRGRRFTLYCSTLTKVLQNKHPQNRKVRNERYLLLCSMKRLYPPCSRVPVLQHPCKQCVLPLKKHALLWPFKTVCSHKLHVSCCREGELVLCTYWAIVMPSLINCTFTYFKKLLFVCVCVLNNIQELFI